MRNVEILGLFFAFTIMQIVATEDTNLKSLSDDTLISTKCTSEGQLFCMSCFQIGSCVTGSAGFYLEATEPCNSTGAEVCTDSPGGGGLCVQGNPALPPPFSSCLYNIQVDDSNGCKTDYFSDGMYGGYYISLINGVVSDIKCPDYQLPDVEACQCVTDDSLCHSSGVCAGLASLPDDALCERYYDCASPSWIRESCIEGECFDTATCRCYIPGYPDCPSCGFRHDDEDSNDYGYINCENGGQTVQTCAPDVFDQDSCACVEFSGCPDCGYKPEMDTPDCTDYFYCFDGVDLPATCSSGQCYHAESCQCIIE